MFPKLLMKVRQFMMTPNQDRHHLPTMTNHHQDHSTTSIVIIQKLYIINHQKNLMGQSQDHNYIIRRPLCMMFMNLILPLRLKSNPKMIILVKELLFMTQLLFIEVMFQLNPKLKLMPEVGVVTIYLTQCMGENFKNSADNTGI